MNIYEKVLTFFESILIGYENNLKIDDNENIFESGFVDSYDALALVVFIEEEFNIQIVDDDLDLANFMTINRIVQFVNRKLSN